MADTTTYAAIRDRYVSLIEALTPAIIPGSDYLFRRSPKHQRLRAWAPRTGSAAFRKFEIVRGTAAVAEPEVQDPSAVDRDEQCTLTIAYPVEWTLALYGREDIDDVEAVMRRDARQIRDLLFSSGSYLAGQSAGFPEIQAPDRADEKLWFQEIQIRLLFLEAQSLT